MKKASTSKDALEFSPPVPSLDIGRLIEWAVDQIADKLAEHQANAVPVEIEEPRSADKFFTSQELAKRWNMDVKQVYTISDTDLPRSRVGPSRGKTLIWAPDVYRYEGTLTTEQYHAIQKGKLPLLESEAQEPVRLRRLPDAQHGYTQQENGRTYGKRTG